MVGKFFLPSPGIFQRSFWLPDAMLGWWCSGGGVALAMREEGFARGGAFSNEAGLGTSAIASAAAITADHPGRPAVIALTEWC